MTKKTSNLKNQIMIATTTKTKNKTKTNKAASYLLPGVKIRTMTKDYG